MDEDMLDTAVKVGLAGFLVVFAVMLLLLAVQAL